MNVIHMLTINISAKATDIFSTAASSILNFLEIFPKQSLGMITFSKLSFSASEIRCSMPDTERISQDNKVFGSIGMSRNDMHFAAAILMSTDISFKQILKVLKYLFHRQQLIILPSRFLSLL